MLKSLKYALNSYEDKELENISLYCNGNEIIAYLVDEYSIELLNNEYVLEVKEKKHSYYDWLDDEDVL